MARLWPNPKSFPNKCFNSGEIPDTTLERYLKKLIEVIREKGVKDNDYDGILVHVNNLDVILSEPDGEKALVRFFDEIRDLLTFDNIHYVFIGPKDIYKRVISSRNRVSSIVSDSPILIDSLSKTQIIEALNLRYDILSSPGTELIKPIHHDVISKLYDLYGGDIRNILNTLSELASSVTYPHTTKVNEAILKLEELIWRDIEDKNLSERVLDILEYIATSGKGIFQQKELASQLGIQGTNMSNYFSILEDHDVIKLVKQEGRDKYYGLNRKYKLLILRKKNEKSIAKYMKKNKEQLELINLKQ